MSAPIDLERVRADSNLLAAVLVGYLVAWPQDQLTSDLERPGQRDPGGGNHRLTSPVPEPGKAGDGGQTARRPARRRGVLHRDEVVVRAQAGAQTEISPV